MKCLPMALRSGSSSRRCIFCISTPVPLCASFSGTRKIFPTYLQHLCQRWRHKTLCSKSELTRDLGFGFLLLNPTLHLSSPSSLLYLSCSKCKVLEFPATNLICLVKLQAWHRWLYWPQGYLHWCVTREARTRPKRQYSNRNT